MMKHLFYFILTVSICLFAGCKGKQQKSEDKMADTEITWVSKIHDFGDLSEGEEICHSYYFTNTGDHQLMIRKVETGCGCTTVNYKKSPISPGEKEKIEIAFNSAGRYGKQYKEIRIFANIPGNEAILNFTANVK